MSKLKYLATLILTAFLMTVQTVKADIHSENYTFHEQYATSSATQLHAYVTDFIDLYPPSEFSLIQPNNFEITKNPRVTFVWEESHDEKRITDYNFHLNMTESLGSKESFSFHATVPNLGTGETKEYRYWYSDGKYHLEPKTDLPEGKYSWHVTVTDSQNTTSSVSWNFTYSIAESCKKTSQLDKVSVTNPSGDAIDTLKPAIILNFPQGSRPVRMDVIIDGSEVFSGVSLDSQTQLNYSVVASETSVVFQPFKDYLPKKTGDNSYQIKLVIYDGDGCKREIEVGAFTVGPLACSAEALMAHLITPAKDYTSASAADTFVWEVCSPATDINSQTFTLNDQKLYTLNSTSTDHKDYTLSVSKVSKSNICNANGTRFTLKLKNPTKVIDYNNPADKSSWNRWQITLKGCHKETTTSDIFRFRYVPGSMGTYYWCSNTSQCTSGSLAECIASGRKACYINDEAKCLSNAELDCSDNPPDVSYFWCSNNSQCNKGALSQCGVSGKNCYTENSGANGCLEHAHYECSNEATYYWCTTTQTCASGSFTDCQNSGHKCYRQDGASYTCSAAVRQDCASGGPAKPTNPFDNIPEEKIDDVIEIIEKLDDLGLDPEEIAELIEFITENDIMVDDEVVDFIDELEDLGLDPDQIIEIIEFLGENDVVIDDEVVDFIDELDKLGLTPEQMAQIIEFISEHDIKIDDETIGFVEELDKFGLTPEQMAEIIKFIAENDITIDQEIVDFIDELGKHGITPEQMAAIIKFVAENNIVVGDDTVDLITKLVEDGLTPKQLSDLVDYLNDHPFQNNPQYIENLKKELEKMGLDPQTINDIIDYLKQHGSDGVDDGIAALIDFLEKMGLDSDQIQFVIEYLHDHPDLKLTPELGELIKMLSDMGLDAEQIKELLEYLLNHPELQLTPELAELIKMLAEMGLDTKQILELLEYLRNHPDLILTKELAEFIRKLVELGLDMEQIKAILDYMNKHGGLAISAELLALIKKLKEMGFTNAQIIDFLKFLNQNPLIGLPAELLALIAFLASLGLTNDQIIAIIRWLSSHSITDINEFMASLREFLKSLGLTNDQISKILAYLYALFMRGVRSGSIFGEIPEFMPNFLDWLADLGVDNKIIATMEALSTQVFPFISTLLLMPFGVVTIFFPLPRGRIFDSKTGKGVANALVIVQKDGQYVNGTITSRTGYCEGFKLPPGKYQLVVSSLEHKFPSQAQNLRDKHATKKSYTGKDIEVTSEFSPRVTCQVPVDLDSKAASESDADDQNANTTWRTKLWSACNRVFNLASSLWGLSFLVVLVFTMIYPIWLNIFVLGIHLVGFVRRLTSSIHHVNLTGRLVDSDGAPLSNVELAITQVAYNRHAGTTITNKQGYFEFYLNPIRQYTLTTNSREFVELEGVKDNILIDYGHERKVDLELVTRNADHES